MPFFFSLVECHWVSFLCMVDKFGNYFMGEIPPDSLGVWDTGKLTVHGMNYCDTHGRWRLVPWGTSSTEVIKEQKEGKEWLFF